MIMLLPEEMEALDKSIEKWETLDDGALQGGADCPLCELYADTDCSSCPVMIATGENSCTATPFYDYRAKIWEGFDASREREAMTEMLRDIRKVCVLREN